MNHSIYWEMLVKARLDVPLSGVVDAVVSWG